MLERRSVRMLPGAGYPRINIFAPFLEEGPGMVGPKYLPIMDFGFP